MQQRTNTSPSFLHTSGEIVDLIKTEDTFNKNSQMNSQSEQLSRCNNIENITYFMLISMCAFNSKTLSCIVLLRFHPFVNLKPKIILNNIFWSSFYCGSISSKFFC